MPGPLCPPQALVCLSGGQSLALGSGIASSGQGTLWPLTLSCPLEGSLEVGVGGQEEEEGVKALQRRPGMWGG